jgi:dolichyl-phosphate beta-glucosyltransferase
MQQELRNFVRESHMANLTLVVPVFNESHRWQDDYWSDLLSLDQVRWIFVDDGSTDQTYEILMKLPSPARYEILRLSTNQGKGEAVRAGILHFFDSQETDARLLLQHSTRSPDLVGFIDADGSITKSDVSRIFEIAKTKISLKTEPASNYPHLPVNAIWSSRVALNGRNIERKISRHYIGRIINTLLSPNFHSIPYDPQCGFKIFEASGNFKKSIEMPFKTRWFFDLEIVLKWKKENESELNIWEEPLETWKEISGSHLSVINIFSIFREIFYIIFESRRNSKESKRRGNGS